MIKRTSDNNFTTNVPILYDDGNETHVISRINFTQQQIGFKLCANTHTIRNNKIENEINKSSHNNLLNPNLEALYRKGT